MAAKIWRIGVLEFGSKGEGEFAPAFVKAMARLGYVEGKSITYDCRYANRDMARVAQLAAQMVQTKPDAIVAPGTPFATALLRETASIPLLTSAADPVGNGFARSLARPGRNVTGLSTSSFESVLKSIELLKAIIPGQWKLALVVGNDQFQFFVRLYEEAARQNGVPTVRMSFKDKGEVDRGFASMRSQGIRMIVGGAFPPGYADDASMHALAMASGVSTVMSSEEAVAKGVLLSYEARHTDPESRMANLLDKILRGTPVGEIPFEQPTTFRVAINLKTAKALGITVPRDVLLRIDKVYE